MFEILKSLTFKDLPVKPPLIGRPKLSEDLQQTVALLVGWDKSTRRLVSVSPTGVLHAAQPLVKGIVNILADQASYNYQGGDIPTSEVLIKSSSANVSRIWVNVGDVATVDTGYPLNAGEHVVFSINNLHSLHIHIVGDTEKASVIYSR